MRSALSEYLVICDMDNTLLTAKEGVPDCNRAVIRLFTELGGLFTVATGRPPASIRAALRGIPLSVPAISCNGALLYDLSRESVLHRVHYKLVNPLRISKPQLAFSRMNIHIHFHGIDIHKKAIHRLQLIVQHVRIGAFDGVSQKLIPYKTPVDLTVLSVGSCATGRRQSHPTIDTS